MHGLIQSMKTSSVASEMIEQMLAEALGSALSETTDESVQVRRAAGQELPTGSPTSPLPATPVDTNTICAAGAAGLTRIPAPSSRPCPWSTSALAGDDPPGRASPH